MYVGVYVWRGNVCMCVGGCVGGMCVCVCVCGCVCMCAKNCVKLIRRRTSITV